MNLEGQQKKILWIAIISGGLLIALLLTPALLPSSDDDHAAPVLSPQTAAEAVEGPDAPTETDPGTQVIDPAAANTGDDNGTGGFDLGGQELFDLAWRLGLVIVIIGVAVVALRWWGRRTAGPKSNTGFVRVIDTLAISNGRTIHLLALGSRVITIGATESQISFLNELSEDESKQVLDRHEQDTDVDLPGFADELLRMLRRDSNAPTAVNHETVIGEEG